MKNFIIAGLALTLTLFNVSCHRGNLIMINDGENDLIINYSGDVKFNEDETAIASIIPEGYLHYKKNDRKLSVESDYNGHLKYELSDDGRTIDINSPEGKKILAIAIQDMINIGFDAKGRLERIYSKGGNEGILREVDNLKSDYVKHLYLQFLITSDSIDNKELRRAIAKIGSAIGSDFDKSSLLRSVPVGCFEDSLTADSWFESVRSLGSDFEKSNTLQFALRHNLSIDEFDEVIDLTQTVGSDYEKSSILKAVMAKRSFSDTLLDKTIDAIHNIGSDFDKANLLRQLIRREQPAPGDVDKMLEAVEDLSSDFDKDNLLKELLLQGLPQGGGFDKMMGIINHLGNDFDKVNLFREIASKNIQTEDEWITLINSTTQIGSDFDRGNLLTAIASNMPRSENIRVAYSKAAKTINSEQDYGRVMKAMN